MLAHISPSSLMYTRAFQALSPTYLYDENDEPVLNKDGKRIGGTLLILDTDTCIVKPTGRSFLAETKCLDYDGALSIFHTICLLPAW